MHKLMLAAVGACLLSATAMAQTPTFPAEAASLTWMEGARVHTNANGTPDTNVTFTYNPATGQISWTGGFPAGSPQTADTLTLNASKGFTLGTLTFNFETGAYTYFTGGVANQGDSFDVSFIARDTDGDVTTPTTLTFSVVDGHPVARPCCSVKRPVRQLRRWAAPWTACAKSRLRRSARPRHARRAGDDSADS